MKLGLKQSLYNAEVRNRRLALGLSQAKLGLKLGVSGQAINRIETMRNADPNNPTVKKLASFFNVEPETLCPEWLKVLKDVKTTARIEREITPLSIGAMADRLYALEAPDDRGETEDVEEFELRRDWLKRVVLLALTQRESQILLLFLELKSRRAVAAQLGCSTGNVSNSLTQSRLKLEIQWQRHLKGTCIECNK